MLSPSMETRLRKTVEYAANIFKHNWHLGLTAFGGPPVHFKIVCLMILVEKLHSRTR